MHNDVFAVIIPSVAEWPRALESDASAGGESPVRAPVRGSNRPTRSGHLGLIICSSVAVS